MRLSTFGTFFFILFSFQVLAQQKTVSLGLPWSDTERPEKVLKKLANAKSDTAKVSLLNQASGLYWFRRFTTDKHMDTCYMLADKAYGLAKKSGDENGAEMALFMLCKVYEERGDTVSALALQSRALPWQKIRILLVISEYIVFKKDAKKNYLDKALPYINEAKAISERLHLDAYRYECLLLLGKYYFKLGEELKGEQTIYQIVTDAGSKGNLDAAAHYSSELGLYMPESVKSYKRKIKYYSISYNYSLKSGDLTTAAYTLRDIASLNLGYGSADSAERQMLQVVAMLKRAGQKLTIATYLYLADVYEFKGNYQKALQSALSALDIYNKYRRGEFDRHAEICGYLAEIYKALGETRKSYENYKIVFEFYKQQHKDGMYYLCYQMVQQQTELGQALEAKKTLIAFEKTQTIKLAAERQLIYAAFGNIYEALNDVPNAEKFYRRMILLDKKVQEEQDTQLWNENAIGSNIAKFIMGEFYVKHFRYNEARPYLQTFVDHPGLKPSAERLRDVYLLLFKIDSAAGNFPSAIKNFQAHKKMSDSLLNEMRSKQLADLEIQYDVSQKQQHIDILDANSKIEHAEVRRANLERDITVGGICFMVCVAGLLYNGYRNKNRSNRHLQIQKTKIDNQYNLLEKALKDKEWLLKEIHHRVKNNLQIVISLLNAQSTFLGSTEAVEAINQSKNRIHAIALIHQKLYGNTNVSQINLQAYVTDLIAYLNDSFDAARHGVIIDHIVEALKIEISQAVPLGLIINEAITNAIKYAFDGQPGIIKVRISKLQDEMVRLEIADSGKGLPPEFEVAKKKSLGIQMMSALSRQLGGKLKITNLQGVQVSVSFRISSSGERLEQMLPLDNTGQS